MFNTKPIPFKVVVSVLRSDEHMRIMEDERRTGIPLFSVPPGIYQYEFVAHHNLNLNSKPDKKIINAEKTFKEDKCVICLTNPPNILFCNCGHLALCVECSKAGENLENCPICKTENTNLRIIE